jgi:hypothetical protein
MSSSSADGSDCEDSSDGDAFDKESFENSNSDLGGNSDNEAKCEMSNESDSNSYDEANFMEPAYVQSGKICRQRLSEEEKTRVCLSDDAINALINKCACTRARITESCPNEFLCSDKLTKEFGLVKTRAVIKQFRLKFWTHSLVNKKACIKNRRIALLRDLNSLYLRDENHDNGSIDYKISGRRICKSFYFEATGMSVRMFNDAVAYVLGNRSSDDLEKFLNKTGKKEGIPVPKKLKSHLTDSNSQHVVKFLNNYFTFKVEWSPHERDVRYIHMTYKYLYKKFYIDYCDKKHITPVTLEQFYRIRKHYCPNFKKSKTIRPGGWNHVKCDTCDSLQRDIMRLEDESEESRQKQKEFMDHLKKQDCCR